jgi:hypothetical protein
VLEPGSKTVAVGSMNRVSDIAVRQALPLTEAPPLQEPEEKRGRPVKVSQMFR